MYMLKLIEQIGTEKGFFEKLLDEKREFKVEVNSTSSDLSSLKRMLSKIDDINLKSVASTFDDDLDSIMAADQYKKEGLALHGGIKITIKHKEKAHTYEPFSSHYTTAFTNKSNWSHVPEHFSFSPVPSKVLENLSSDFYELFANESIMIIEGSKEKHIVTVKKEEIKKPTVTAYELIREEFATPTDPFIFLDLFPKLGKFDSSWVKIETEGDGELIKCNYGRDKYNALVKNLKTGRHAATLLLMEI